MEKTNGSALLIVILVVSALTICITGFLASSTLLHDISLKRVEYEQKYRATCGGLNYAVSLCSKNFDKLVQAGQHDKAVRFEIELDNWKVGKNIEFKNKIYIKVSGKRQPNIVAINARQPDSLNLGSVLCDLENNKIFEVACQLQKASLRDGKTGSVRVLNWKICD